MANVKEKIKIVEFQSEDSYYDEILAELGFTRIVKHGLEDSRQNRTVSNEVMEKRIHEWLK